jgi:hypothetical protein
VVSNTSMKVPNITEMATTHGLMTGGVADPVGLDIEFILPIRPIQGSRVRLAQALRRKGMVVRRDRITRRAQSILLSDSPGLPKRLGNQGCCQVFPYF